MDNDRSGFESPRTFGFIALGAVVVGCALWGWIVWAYPTLNERAQFGNLFGGINTLFAALAFAALTVTLLLQQRALELQRSQLAEQHREVEEQNRRIALQAFESMLFQLLSLHHDIASGVHIKRSQKDMNGREALRTLADEAQGDVANYLRDHQKSPAMEVVQQGYERFHQRSRGELDHYFRNLYHIIKFIDGRSLSDPRRYSSLVRAQLSPAELILLFYNGLSPYGEKFKPLMEKYALLEPLPESEIQQPELKALYLLSAYG